MYFPENFPFKLENDFPGLASITLKRHYKFEDIVVTVRTPSVFTPLTAQNYQYYKSSNFIMQLTVQIFPSISEGSNIAFECSVFSSGLLIENVYVGYSDKLVFRWVSLFFMMLSFFWMNTNHFCVFQSAMFNPVNWMTTWKPNSRSIWRWEESALAPQITYLATCWTKWIEKN